MVMGNYAWAFSQSELGKYFEWIIIIIIVGAGESVQSSSPFEIPTDDGEWNIN